MNNIQKIGLALFALALILFTLSLGMSNYKLTADSLYADAPAHREVILTTAQEKGILDKEYTSNLAFIADFKEVLQEATIRQEEKAKIEFPEGFPEGFDEWTIKIGDWKLKDYTFKTVKHSSIGILPNNVELFFLLTFGLGILGGLLYIIPVFKMVPGIKNNGVYHDPLTRGLKVNTRALFLGATIIGILVYGLFYMNHQLFWPLVSTAIALIIIGLVLYSEKNNKSSEAPRSASPNITGWLGVVAGIYLIGFYILLYWAPAYITNWVIMIDPISLFLSGGEAGYWFLYGLLYSIIVVVMGIRMMAKYRHNKYQIIRTCSVMFFQTCFAFILPEILLRLNQPWYDFKNIWPLNYTFFFDSNIKELVSSGGLGIFMLVWGIALALIGVPVITYFFGKRWYCSWVCGCGGLAETMGDPYRQLSDKSVRAWKFERWIIHGVLAAAVVMTIMVLYTYFTNQSQILIFNSNSVRQWYGFLIGSAFAGIVGTGFYPLMGNRAWCRFGCPLAAYLGLVQRFKSRFRITVNGGQCISCGNCSTYCEMGIDVRHYAQKGQDVVRASCVGCGICAAVCPRGVLRLENSSLDANERTQVMKAIHISEEKGAELMGV